MTTDRKATGNAGEAAAVAFLERSGYRIVDTNVHLGARRDGLPGELDIIAWENETLCFIEVKTRNQTAATVGETPAEAVTPAKQRQIARLALAYATRHGILSDLDGTAEIALRFDVVAVRRFAARGREVCRCELIRGAFYAPEGVGE